MNQLDLGKLFCSIKNPKEFKLFGVFVWLKSTYYGITHIVSWRAYHVDALI